MDGLTASELDAYRDKGYVLRRGLYDQEMLQRLERRFVDLVEGRVATSGRMQIMNDVMVVKGAVEPQSALHAVNKLFSFEDDAELFSYVLHPGLVACLQSLLGEEVHSVSTNVFNKPPGVDGKHPFHQDLRYYRIRPAEQIVGVWTAVRPAMRETGCLAVIPGSHHEGLLEHSAPDWQYVNHGFYGVAVDRDKRVHVEMMPGDTLFFHPLLVHGSGSNRGDDFRRAISAHFVGGAATSEGRDWRDNPLVRRVDAPGR